MNNKNSQINKIKDDLSATLRAMALNEELQIDFSEDCLNDFFSWNQNLVLNPLQIILPEIEDGDLEDVCRAAGDMALSYLLFHNRDLHQSKNFTAEDQETFDEFEKVRVIANIENIYLGSVKNILSKIEEGLSIANPSLILLGELFAKKLLPQTKNLITETEKNFSKKIVTEIKKLAKKINDQQEFALGVERLLKMMKESQEKNEADEKEQNEKIKSDEEDLNLNQENIEQEGDNSFEGEEIEENISEDKNQKNKELKEDKISGKIKQKLEKQSAKPDRIEYKAPYKIYSNKFDEVIFPQKLIAKVELESLRNQLDLKISRLSGVSRKMSLKLKRKLLSKRNAFVEYNSSRGVLDKKKLTRLVIDPTLEDIWVNHKTHEYNDTALTILLDNSGSMRGNPIVMSALACETIAEILEKFAVKTEIIGFTTGDWKGGRVRKLWESNGRPENPGRLNELRHIIYKHFNQSFKKAKINLGLMLKEGTLKENIDGEALLYARSRLMQQDQKRKILMVISDGTPVDDSTTLVNDDRILTDHLLHVINNIEKKSKVEIVGIGIGHATDDYYKNSITVKTVNDLGDAMIEKLVNLL